MSQTHLFRLGQMKPQTVLPGGSRAEATQQNFPLLKGMSFYKLVLEPKAVREPHWHANADELGYCLKGEALLYLYATGNNHSVILVKAGEAFFVPSGSLHAVENMGAGACELILSFSHEQPEDFALSTTFGMFTNAVLGNTWGVAEAKFKGIPHATKQVFIALQEKASPVPDEARYTSPYRYSLSDSSPLVATSAGSARVARLDRWPILRQQALYSLELTDTGMREPHWHPETAEMGYVKSGKGRMSILSASGSVDTYEINEGDIYFIPKAYPHHIENLDKSPLDILIFFDQPLPGDIGFTGSVKSHPNALLEAVLKTPADLLNSLPTYDADLLIVNRVNPVDPV